MTKPTVRIHNVETNEVIDRQMTEQEFAQYEIAQAATAARLAEAEAKTTERQAILSRLGITEDEAKLLLS